VTAGTSGRFRRLDCDVCSAISTVDDEPLADVVARTAAVLNRLLPKFTDAVSSFTFSKATRRQLSSAVFTKDGVTALNVHSFDVHEIDCQTV